MGDLTREIPKCMTPIGKGYTILSWQLELLKQTGISDVVITTGPFSEMLEKYASENMPEVEYVHNPLYAQTNYIYSMFLARELLEDDLLLFHGDLVPEPTVVEDLCSASGSVVAVEPGIDLPEKDFKARLAEGRVTEIGIDVFGEDCLACQPAYKLTREDMGIWLRAIETFCGAGITGVYAENALNTVLEKVFLRPFDLGGRLCNEIDNAEDLAAVSERFAQIRKGGQL